MPRRSSRQKKSSNAETETASDIATDTKPSATNSTVESVSKENQSQKTSDVQPTDEKSESTEAPTAVPVEKVNAKAKDDDDSDDEFIDDRESSTLATTRSRRARTQRVSYKDESSSEDEESEDEDSEDDNPLFAGLNKAQRAAMKAKMAGLQKSSETAASKEREQSIEEIISSFEFNIGEKVTKREAGFAFDFCRKHQVDINDKIEEEGDFFLINIREMMEERALQLKAQGASGAASKKKKSKNSNDSDSEFDMNEYGDDSDSAYDEDDSDWENSDIDHENLLSEDEDDGGKKKKKRRRKNVFRADGKQYFAKGRLLLNDALKDTTNFEGWSAARVQAWKNKEVNPNAYYYRFNNPGVAAKNGRIGAEVAEHELFMRRIVELGVNMHWGKFSMKIPGRVGYQCSNYWRQMMKDCWVKDPNYWIRADGSFQFKRAKKGSIPDAIRKYSFVVLKDPSKVFAPLPGVHPKRPSDAALAKYLQKECKTLSEKEKAGGKRSAPKKRSTKNSTKSAAGESEKESEELKKAKDNAPKKPQTAYFLFTATVREELKKSDPNLKVTEIAKESGKRWRALGAAEKKGFTERAAIAKKEYTVAMDAYLASEEGKWLREDQKRAEEERKAKKANKKKDGAPKKPQTAYFLYLASVREDIKKEFGISKASDVAKEGGKKWKALGEAEKKPFADEAAQLKKAHKLKVAEFAEAEAKKKAAETETEAEAAVESDKAKVDAEIATETATTKETEVEKEKEKDAVSEAEAESESAKPKKKGKKGKGKGKGRGKKRKHDGISDDLEPAQKKRKLSEECVAAEAEADADEGDAEGADDGPMSVLANVMDLMTGERVTKPAMSPYGHVMEYDSWCSILRNPKTKNKCPFTQQPMTRRQLIKLDEHNIEQYQAQIVNLTADDLQKLSA